MRMVALEDDEVAERADEMAGLEIEYKAIDAERAENQADYKAKLAAIEKRIDELAQIIKTRKEPRDDQMELAAVFDANQPATPTRGKRA